MDASDVDTYLDAARNCLAKAAATDMSPPTHRIQVGTTKYVLGEPDPKLSESITPPNNVPIAYPELQYDNIFSEPDRKLGESERVGDGNIVRRRNGLGEFGVWLREVVVALEFGKRHGPYHSSPPQRSTPWVFWWWCRHKRQRIKYKHTYTYTHTYPSLPPSLLHLPASTRSLSFESTTKINPWVF